MHAHLIELVETDTFRNPLLRLTVAANADAGRVLVSTAFDAVFRPRARNHVVVAGHAAQELVHNQCLSENEVTAASLVSEGGYMQNTYVQKRAMAATTEGALSAQCASQFFARVGVVRRKRPRRAVRVVTSFMVVELG